jgi:RNA polymerase sigma-70 factor (ECF subfamily)
MSQPTEFELKIHQRLLARDPIAPAVLSDAYLDRVIDRLRRRYREVQDGALITEAAIDAVLSYVEDPAQYKPDQGGLLSYLLIAAKGDLLNALAKERRVAARFEPLVRIDEDADGRNRLAERKELIHYDEYNLPEGNAGLDLIDLVAQIITDPRDRQIVDLMMKGERRTDVFAELLGIPDREKSEREKIVKRNKDRLKRRLERLGIKIGG